MLYLLTVSDSISTGPTAWNDWTLALLKNLFLNVLSILKKGELATGEVVETVRNVDELTFATMRTDLGQVCSI